MHAIMNLFSHLCFVLRQIVANVFKACQVKVLIVDVHQDSSLMTVRNVHNNLFGMRALLRFAGFLYIVLILISSQ